jgi:hypothetical protein
MLPPTTLVHTSDPKPNAFQPLPAGATSFVLTWDTGPFIDNTHRYNISFQFWDSAFAFHGVQQVLNKVSGQTGTFVGTILSTYLYYNVTVNSPDAGPYPAGNSVGCTMQLFCGGATSGSPSIPCCPPDPVAMGVLTRIRDTLDLIQRQLLPFAYIASTAHSGLTGSGSFDVLDLIGVKVVLTTIPGSLGSDDSVPSYLFDAGWISIQTADGFIDETRLHATSQVWQPRLMAEATLFGYSFHPGVVATVTELVREP